MMAEVWVVMVALVASLVAVALCILVCWCICIRRKGQPQLLKRRPGIYDTPIRYELSRKSLPPVAGLPLRILSYLYNSQIGSWILVPFALKQGYFDLAEKLDLDEPPTFYPLVDFDGPVSDGSEVDVEHLIVKPQEKENGFRFVSISDYYHKYRSGVMTPNDVAENIISALYDAEEGNPPLKAVVQWNEAEIKRMANESTNRFKLRNKEPLSVMDGVPVCIKEELSCKPYVWRVGTSCRSTACIEDATLVAKLRAAGAMIIGVSNMHELGMGTTGNNVSRFHGTARNPYNTDHYPGGSSSGSAVAVAAGLCPVSIGTDGGGSVRIPAALCGVVGLKSTYGRFSCGGCAPLAFTPSHVGPLCGNVRDTAIMYGMLAGPDPRDFNTKWQPPVTLDKFENTDMNGIKIGIYRTYFQDADPEIVQDCQKAVDFLKKEGAEIVDIEIAELEEIRIMHAMVILSEFRSGMQEDFNKHVRELSSENALLLASTSQFTALGYVNANKQRTRSINFLKEHVFSKVDVIITPATGVTAPKIHPNELKYGLSKTALTLDLMRYVSIGNLTGIPCLTVPIGYDLDGLPIGLQIMGRWWEDHVILRVGNVVERFAEKLLREPQVYYENLK